MPAPRFGSLAGWLEWQQTLHPRAIEPGLARIMRVAVRTGWRPPSCPVITVAGTNGKGSCVALLDAMMRAGGYRVATFTSPHLVDYTERIRVDGQRIAPESLVVAFERVADALAGESLTFFEFNTLAALLVFETAAPDAIVLEVGMGGRLDAVRIVDPDVAVVVSIGLDHMEWLGTDLDSIAREKAGIFASRRPAIYGGSDPPPRSLVEHARALSVPLRVRGRDFDGYPDGAGGWEFRCDHDDVHTRIAGLPRPALAGRVQIANAATTVAALLELADRLPLAPDALARGLARVSLPGRFQRVADTGFEWILDVAHNPAAARVLAENLRDTRGDGRTIAVCGMLADKHVQGVLRELADCVDLWIAASTGGERGLAARDLAAQAREIDIEMQPGGSLRDALTVARDLARHGDRIIVFGSFLSVGPALATLAERGLCALS